MRARTIFTVALLMFPLSIQSQSAHVDTFDNVSPDRWSMWKEVHQPRCGARPRAANGFGFLFINACDLDPLRNQEHLTFRDSDSASGAQAEFIFTNAANGGNVRLENGSTYCLNDWEVPIRSSNEIFIITLRDTGSEWIGACVGDFTLIDPSFAPDEMSANPYSTLGIIQKTNEGITPLALRSIGPLQRYARISAIIDVDDSDPAIDTVNAFFTIQNAGTFKLRAETEPLSDGPGGIVYAVGNGWPCTNLPQREVAVDQFSVFSF